MNGRDPVNPTFARRTFCSVVAGAAASLLAAGDCEAAGDEVSIPAERIYKAVKVSMIQGDMPLLEKFRIAKDAGFDGISLFAPDQFDVKEAIIAQDKTGLMIHNVNNAVHWQKRLSDPDPEVRQQSLDALFKTIQFAHEVGASSILLVVGKVTDPVHENHDQVWERSMDGIRQALPLASKLGVRILCENVNNGFCEDPQRWAEYLDEIADPWVGAFFDIGNHQSRGGADHWIRTLGERIVKLDVKGHDSKLRKNCDIFDGDVNWAAVREEVARLRFTGWATAEVSGGGAERLQRVAQEMNEALGLRSNI